MSTLRQLHTAAAHPLARIGFLIDSAAATIDQQIFPVCHALWRQDGKHSVTVESAATISIAFIYVSGVESPSVSLDRHAPGFRQYILLSASLFPVTATQLTALASKASVANTPAPGPHGNNASRGLWAEVVCSAPQPYQTIR